MGATPAKTEGATVGVLVVGHGQLPEATVAAAEQILGVLPRPTRACGVDAEATLEATADVIARAIAALDSGAGVLILIDAMGATPYNAADRAAGSADRVRLVTGFNLPMLVRVYNYPELALAELADSAAAGGRSGIIDMT